MPTIATLDMQVAVEPEKIAWEFYQRNPNPSGLGGVNSTPLRSGHPHIPSSLYVACHL